MALKYDADQKRPDGRFYVDQDHKRFCADYHAPHRSGDCWYKPKSSGKAKGKGKDKGKAKGSGRAS